MVSMVSIVDAENESIHFRDPYTVLDVDGDANIGGRSEQGLILCYVHE